MPRPKEDLSQLEKQFEDPLKDVKSRELEFGDNVSDVIDRLASKLNNQSEDWNVKNDTLLEVMEYLKSGIATSPNFEISKLASGISSCVADLRSALVKRGSLLITACAEIYGKDYVSSIDIIVPSLFKQLSHGTAIISNSVRLALRAIARFVQNRRTSRLFISKQQSKSNAQRVAVAEAIKIMREEWPPQIIEGIDNELVAVLKFYTEDAAPEVRQIAKESLNMAPTPAKKSVNKSPRSLTPTNKSLTPRNKSKMKTPTRIARKTKDAAPKQEEEEEENEKPKPVAKKTTKKVLFGPPKIQTPPEEISEYMPPRTLAEAKSFLRILNDIITNNNYDDLIGLEELLAPSIISATKVLPQSNMYIKILPQLYQKYTDIFSVQIHDLLIAFNFDPTLLAESVNVYGEQQIAETFVGRRDSEENESLQFFITLFNHKYEINITPKIRQYLLKLIQQFRTSNDITVIENAIKVPETDSNLNKIVDQLISKIKSHKKWVTIYQQLVIQLSIGTLQPEYLDMIQDNLVSQFTSILKQGTQTQKQEVRTFLITGAMNLRGITFSQLTEPLLPLIMNENRVEREKTEECFQVLLNDPQTVTNLIDILKDEENEEKAHAVLSIFLQYIQNGSIVQVSTLLPLIINILSSLIKSDVVGVRRLSILILVEFKCKVPKEFNPYFKKLSIAHQKLINLYSNKRGQ